MSICTGLAALRRPSLLGFLACLLTAVAGQQSTALEPMPCPDDGTVANGVYSNKYFDLSYPLPSGWKEGLAGPPPSDAGYYVLASLVPAGKLTGTILIAAQDLFFAAAAPADAGETARMFAKAMAQIDGMTIDRQPAEVRIGGRIFDRVDFSGVGLYRSTLFTSVRCHAVSFNLTASSPELRDALVQGLDRIGGARDGTAAEPDPDCVKSYASPDNLLAKVDPVAKGPMFMPIPVRIVIGPKGGVKNVHVIRATPEQRDSIAAALAQWRFKPHAEAGRAVATETGLLIEFTSGGGVNYSDGRRPVRGNLIAHE